MLQRIDPVIEDFITDTFGPINPAVSTLTYEIGTGGPTRRVIGYHIRPTIEQPLLLFLPLQAEDDETKVNHDNHMYLLSVNPERVITIMYEAVLT